MTSEAGSEKPSKKANPESGGEESEFEGEFWAHIKFNV